jgi:hypothetical protein
VQAFKENDMGSFDGQMTKTEYQEIDSGDVVIEDNAERTVTQREGEYLLAETVRLNFSQPDVDVPGTKVELKKKPTDVASFNAVKTTIVTHNQVNVATEEDGGKAVTRTENTALLEDELTPPEAADGHIVSFVKEARPDGKIKAVATDELEKDQTAAGGESGLLRTVAVEMHTSGDTVGVTGGAQNVKVEVEEAPTRGNKKRTRKVTETLLPWSGTDVVVSKNGVVELKRQILKNQTTAPAAGANQDVRLGDNGLGGYDAIRDTRALDSGASGTKAQHISSVIDWDVSRMNLKTPTWSVTTNSDTDANITGYNHWLSSMSRSRVITTEMTKTYTLTEPATLTVSSATAGATEGEGVSYSKDSRPFTEGVWEIIEKTITTGPWSAFGMKSLTWVNWVQTVSGAGE